MQPLRMDSPSPPPCGEGSGVGVATRTAVRVDPPPQPSPARGEGAVRARGYSSKIARCHHRGGSVISVTPMIENHRAHRLVACESAPIMACLTLNLIFFAGAKMIRAFALLFAAVTLLAGADQARAQGF